MRIALGVEYDGTDFLGWQRLSHGSSVQGALESALGFVAAQPIEAVGAGRTDSGVHARCQVVHFDTSAPRDMRSWLLGTNSRLPRSVALRWVQPVAEDFHARFSARARRYRYVILNRQVRPALEARFVSWERLPLDVARMAEAARSLLGVHDFSAFRTLACQARSPVRDMQDISVTRSDDRVIVDIQANAFLHHMVRNIVGSLLPVGRGEKPVEWMAELLQGRDRSVAGPTAAAAGLVLLAPLYPPEWNLPDEVTST